MKPPRSTVLAAPAVVVAMLAGCTAIRPSTEPAATATETVRELEEGDHSAGTYTYSQFEPRIEVTLPDDEWTTFHLIPDFFDVAIETEEGPVAVMFLDPIAFLDAEEEEAQAATPQEAIELLADHDGTTLSEPRPVQIGGLSGLEVDADFEIDNTHVIRVSGGDIGFGPSSDVRLAVLEADDGHAGHRSGRPNRTHGRGRGDHAVGARLHQHPLTRGRRGDLHGPMNPIAFSSRIRYWNPEKASGLAVADIPEAHHAALGGLKQQHVQRHDRRGGVRVERDAGRWRTPGAEREQGDDEVGRGRASATRSPSRSPMSVATELITV